MSKHLRAQTAETSPEVVCPACSYPGIVVQDYPDRALVYHARRNFPCRVDVDSLPEADGQ
jgi:uncharacterized protein (DUF3820 family)